MFRANVLPVSFAPNESVDVQDSELCCSTKSESSKNAASQLSKQNTFILLCLWTRPAWKV